MLMTETRETGIKRFMTHRVFLMKTLVPDDLPSRRHERAVEGTETIEEGWGPLWHQPAQ